jgi:hypothetical protein
MFKDYGYSSKRNPLATYGDIWGEMVYISSHSYPWIYEEFLGELHTAR